MSPPPTLIALAVVLIAVLPGSVYTWAFERSSGPYGVTLADRVLRFIGVSLLFHLVLAWMEYAVNRYVASRWNGESPHPPRVRVRRAVAGPRRGTYRVIYQIDDAQHRVTVVGVVHRADAHR